jgi:hypothetical protein
MPLVLEQVPHKLIVRIPASGSLGLFGYGEAILAVLCIGLVSCAFVQGIYDLLINTDPKADLVIAPVLYMAPVLFIPLSFGLHFLKRVLWRLFNTADLTFDKDFYLIEWRLFGKWRYHALVGRISEISEVDVAGDSLWSLEILAESESSLLKKIRFGVGLSMEHKEQIIREIRAWVEKMVGPSELVNEQQQRPQELAVED